ncbi:hypothetical protein Pla123a_09070 [Posidoniimonas polymericola]|uniref:Isoprenylcysteine carboxyl methyltransferase (ICMT) family protein n=1 Tax=Posidoniimonas polymericola TaxID=2528002 RepID=A0A5C5YT44_9BACT|nr:isoprenylcysteine carboxylmethyltransferase family protein [Posidoniimonas polymericola]TWT78118.1 hypothetical protein Pla123a_09070 [Posidoniimonas polymericola]
MEPQPNTEPHARPKRLLPPVALLLSIAAMIALDAWLPIVELPAASPWDAWLRWLGWAAIVAALTVNSAIALSFKRRGTTVFPFRESSVLVTGGLFRRTRNPIYVSMVVVLLGVAAVLGSLGPLVVVPLFMLWITHNVIRVEEQMLTAAFGDDYHDYQRRVRRWI